MTNKYQYEKILTTLDQQGMSRTEFDSLFTSLGFTNDTGTAISMDNLKKIFTDMHTLISINDYESDSQGFFSTVNQQKYIEMLTYNFTQYKNYITGIISTYGSDEVLEFKRLKNHIRNFTPYSWLNRVNYYLLFITSKIKTLKQHLADFFTSKTFSLNSCPIYPDTVQQTLTLSQRDALAIRTSDRMKAFLENTVYNAFLGQLTDTTVEFNNIDSHFDARLASDPTLFKRDFFDKTYLIKDVVEPTEDASGKIAVSDFLKYIIPEYNKDESIALDFYLQLQMSSTQATSSVFSKLIPDDSLYDWKSAGVLENSIDLYNHELIALFDVLFFLSCFIEKLSHIKHFDVSWKHLKNSVKTRLYAMTTVTINYEEDESIAEAPNHATYITSIVSPIQKETIQTDETPEVERGITLTSSFNNTNILLVNNTTDDLGNSDTDKTNLFDSIIYDNEDTENYGNIEDSILPNIGQFFNTNGIFGAQYVVSRENTFTLTLEDVQKQFNLYEGQIISRKDLLKAIDFIFNKWATSMSTYTLHVVTCHSNCHMNIANITSTLEGALFVTKTRTDTACLYRDYCYCGSVLVNTMTITKSVDPKYTENYNISASAPKGKWKPTVTLMSIGGSGNYNSRPETLRATLTIGRYSITKTGEPGDTITFTIPDDGNRYLTDNDIITVRISDEDCACGVTEKEYNANWIYQKQYKITGSFTITGTLKDT